MKGYLLFGSLLAWGAIGAAQAPPRGLQVIVPSQPPNPAAQVVVPRPTPNYAVSSIQPPHITIDSIQPSPVIVGQPIAVSFTLTNPGPVAVGGTIRGQIDGKPLTDEQGNTQSAASLAPGASITGTLRTAAAGSGTSNLQISFDQDGECRDRPGPYGQPVRVCNDRRLAQVSQQLTVFAPAPPPAAEPTLADVAAHWAPVLSHDVDTGWGDRFWGDYITRANFDGDWDSSNNWDNLPIYPLPAIVYYWVNETAAHWYLGYAFFHPRDWSNANVADNGAAHNNDIEAVAVQVERTPAHRFGRFLAMVTVAHHDFYSYTDSDTPAGSEWFDRLSASRTVQGSGSEDIDGDVDFVADDFGLHPVVYVEAEGHGVYGQPRDGYGVSDWVPFDRDSVSDWRGGSWSGIVVPPKSGQPGVPEDRSGWGDGVIFRFEGAADVPTADRSNAPTHFEVVGYALEEVSSLWSRRNCPQTFDPKGEFPGGANPPWRLDDGNDNADPGAIFDRPAHLFAAYFNAANVGIAEPTYDRRSFTLATGDCRD